jgi:hypothetical protein
VNISNEWEYYKNLQAAEETVTEVVDIDIFTAHNISNFKYHFTYRDEYRRLLDKYGLANIAGQGSTFVKAMNIMNWVTKKTYYCGNSGLDKNDIFSIIEYSFDRGFAGAINCEQKAFLLSECLLALKIFAYPVGLEYCIFNETKDKVTSINCHVVVHLYLEEENRWIMFDPSFNAYFTGENDKVLNIVEIRENLKQKKAMNLAQYSLNGNDNIFRKGYPVNFIFNMAFRLSVYDGNLPQEKVYNQNLVFPENVDRRKIYRLKQIANGMNPEDVDILCEKVRYISTSELLAKPQWQSMNTFKP